MISLKQKTSWLAVASASLALAACGGDSSSSSDNLSLDPLTYTGSDAEATVSTDNYNDIAQKVHAVTLAMVAGNSLQSIGFGGPGGPMIPGPRMLSKAVSNVQASVLAEASSLSKTAAASAPAGVLVTSSNGRSYTSSNTAEGECGGSASFETTFTIKSTASEDDDEASPVDSVGEDSGEDISVTFKDYCAYLDDDVTEIMLNGNMTMNYAYSSQYDYVNDTRSVDGTETGSATLRVAIGDDQVVVKSAIKGRNHADYSYDEELDDDVYNPDTFVDDSARVLQISGNGLSGKHTYTESCDVDPEDPTDTTCTESEVINVGGTNYKLEGYASPYGGVYLTVYLPTFGSVIVRSGSSSPALCDNYAGFESGSLSVNNGEISITYSGCDAEPVVSYSGNSDLMLQ
ncbi:MAG: hypothetical protein COB09_19265 [Thalassobium sp.]|nr:MAG: hypothetical protein COB09_19265 [Thalassobium sp.]